MAYLNKRKPSHVLQFSFVFQHSVFKDTKIQMKGEQLSMRSRQLTRGSHRSPALTAQSRRNEVVDRFDATGGVEIGVTVVGEGTQAVLSAFELGNCLAVSGFSAALAGRKAELHKGPRVRFRHKVSMGIQHLCSYRSSFWQLRAAAAPSLIRIALVSESAFHSSRQPMQQPTPLPVFDFHKQY
jgi:hypothetical protein